MKKLCQSFKGGWRKEVKEKPPPASAIMEKA